jgi:hypothetical protein
MLGDQMHALANNYRLSEISGASGHQTTSGCARTWTGRRQCRYIERVEVYLRFMKAKIGKPRSTRCGAETFPNQTDKASGELKKIPARREQRCTAAAECKVPQMRQNSVKLESDCAQPSLNDELRRRERGAKEAERRIATTEYVFALIVVRSQILHNNNSPRFNRL